MWKTQAILAFTLVLGWNYQANAQGCCGECGCQGCIRKVCVWKEEIKKVPVTTYERVCEDFCMPGISQKVGCTCEIDCKGCERCKPERIPQCGKVYTRTKLVKKTVEEEKKTYKWTVEYICDNCQRCAVSNGAGGQGPCTLAQETSQKEAPPPPQLFSVPLMSDRRAPLTNPVAPPPVTVAPPVLR